VNQFDVDLLKHHGKPDAWRQTMVEPAIIPNKHIRGSCHAEDVCQQYQPATCGVVAACGERWEFETMFVMV
jgi:hypothetical protein